MNAIEVRDVRKTYRRYGRRRHFGTLKSALLSGRLLADLRPDEVIEALNDVSFDVPAGRTFGIIGRNGSGKSTLLKLIAGIGKPSSGTVRVQGRVSALIELGAGFHPEISGRENVFINGMMLGLSRRDIAARFDEIVAFAELEDFIDEPVKTYSSGMYMRLGFAVAINVDPDVLLVDEVLAVGDQGFTHKCLDKFAEFRRRGRTVLIVTHSLDMVTRFCDDAVWLDAGRVQAQGEPQHVIDSYLGAVARSEHQSVVAAAAAGENAVEIVEVRLLGRNGPPTTVVASGDPITIEIRVRASHPVPAAVVAFGLFNADGVRCYATDTSVDGVPVAIATEEGTVCCAIDRLDLVAGTYTLDVSVQGADGRSYDHEHRCTFTVRSSVNDHGIFRPPHQWSVSGGVRRRGGIRVASLDAPVTKVVPSRVPSVEEVVGDVRAAQAAGDTVVFTNGVFDLLHPGHVRYLTDARALGDLLVVAVNSDRSVRANKGAGRPIVPDHERAEVLLALAAVDRVVIFDEDTPHAIISRLQPDVLVKGADWGSDNIVGRDVVEARGGRVVRIDVSPGFSTTELVRSVRGGRP